MSLKDELPTDIGLQRKVDRLERESRDAMARARAAEVALENVAKELELMTGLAGASREVPTWLAKTPKVGKKHHGTPWLLLSDLHLDEVVNKAEMMGVNAYNRKIAEQRLERTFTAAVEITRDYWTGIVYDGIVAPLLGDIFSGDIHEELAETNEDAILGSILHWADHLAAGYRLLADEFGHVHVPVVVGNHGRQSRKPRMKFRARTNYDWFLGHLLARMFQGDKRITFDVPESADVMVSCYQWQIMATHGDQARGGGGIAGIWSPIMRLDARKRQRQAAVSQPYDLLVMGHWHNLIFGPSFVVNGSLKGYDEFAALSNFGFEPPSQALFLVTPEHLKTWTAPVLPCERRREGW